MLAGVVAALLAGTAIAQPEKEVESPPGGYNAAKLGEVLKKMGYDAQPQQSPGSYLVTINREGIVYTTRVLVSSDRTNIWITTILDVVPPAVAANPEASRRLLLENETIGPARFTYNGIDSVFHLSQKLGNRAMTPAKLKKAIEENDALARKTAPLWRYEAFVRIGKVPAEVLEPELKKFQGEWTLTESFEAGAKIPDERIKNLKPVIRFDGTKYSLQVGANIDARTIAIDPRGEVGRIDFITTEGSVLTGSYKLEGDVLTIVAPADAKLGRLKDFEMKPGSKNTKLVMKRTPKS